MSEDCIRQAKDIFAQLTAKTVSLQSKRTLSRNAENQLFKNDWRSIDDVYLALYSINLLGLREVRDRGVRGSPGGYLALKIALTDELPSIDLDHPDYQSTELHEGVVADVMKLRARVEKLSPYKLSLCALYIPRLAMEFRLQVDAIVAQQAKGLSPELNRSGFAGGSTL